MASWPLCLVVLLVAFLAACDISDMIGPAYPEKDSTVFLEKHGYSPEAIRSVVEKLPLKPELVRDFSKSRSPDVRFLVSGNPNLTPEQIEWFFKDSNDYARRGVASNPSLTRNQMERLLQDRSHLVLSGLAANPSVPEELLLKLRNDRGIELLWFARNPKLPPVLRNEILQSNNEDAKYWLKVTEERPKK